MYVYITTNLINNKKYIGVCVRKTNSENYLGSGVLLKRAIKKYGVENFKKEIIMHFKTEKDARDFERKLIFEYDAINNDNFYNLVTGGYGGGVKNHVVTQQTRKKISDSHKGKKLSRQQILSMGKITLQYDLNGYFIQSFQTKADAEQLINGKLTKVSGNKTIYAKGFLWTYKNGDIKTKIEPYEIHKNKILELKSKQNAKLGENDVILLIKDRDSGLTLKELSKKYNITQSCVSEILTGKTYKWIWKNIKKQTD